MEELLTLMGNFGFPMVLSIYLLTRLESRIDDLTKNISRLTETLIKNIL